LIYYDRCAGSRACTLETNLGRSVCSDNVLEASPDTAQYEVSHLCNIFSMFNRE